MSNDRRTLNIQKKKKGRKKWLLWILTPLLLILISGTVYGTYLYNKAEDVVSKSYKPIDRTSTIRSKDVHPEVDNITVLFAGVDDSDSRNYNAGSRTDALMMATFNKKQKSVKLLSIPRDSYVYIPSKGYEDKINHAYGKGGIASTIDTVEGLLDIPVDYYVKMNFEAFIDIVDALGGIQAEVPYNLSEKDSKDRRNAINLKKGIQNLNGEQALALARTRHYDSDIERGKRQQEIIKSIMTKATAATSITKYSSILEAVGNNMETDLSFDEMKSFFDYAKAGNQLNIEQLSLKGSNSTIDGIYYYQLDEPELELIKSKLKSQLEIGSSTDSSANDVVENTAS
ncbi:LCP family protein [Bacillus sp. CGMCC 1.16607]|uniref:LCP family protein n=1 Tax=Bacillus sp. CGMCC 1.16607 TaxID=3351842 RepID=UPI0036256B6C